METLLIVLVCVAVGSACGIVVLSAIALGARRERNARTHRLGRLLVIQHPDWE